MYAQNYGAQSPPLSNNPFLGNPSNAHQRFPDLTSSSSSFNTQDQGYNISGGQQGQGYGGGYGGYNNNGAVVNTPGSPPQSPGFHPSSGFGQQLWTQTNPTGYIGQSQIQPQSPGGYAGQQYQTYPPAVYGGQQQQQFPAQQAGYIPGQQQQSYQQYSQPAYGQASLMQQQTYQDVAQFDPYGPQSQQQQQQPQSQFQSQYVQLSSSNPSHPREYIRTHKTELEQWDTYSWKQALNTFDTLKEAWSTRRKDAEARMLQVQAEYGFTGQQEVARLAGLRKEADSNFDSVVASSFQMHEVFQGYRQSGDLASKRRVREATNAALSNLPDWPAPNF